MKKLVYRGAVLLTALVAPAAAQWFDIPTKGIARTRDGKPNLSAPPPKTADGKPDLSGIWEPDGTKYIRSLAADLKPDAIPFQPWAQAAYNERKDGAKGREESDANCLPQGVPKIDAAPVPFKIVETPGLILILYEAFDLYRQIFTDSVRTATAERIIRLPERVGAEGLRDADTPLGDFVADVLREAAGADLAIQNVGGIRAGLPRGDVTVGDLYAALPFDNRIVTVRMEGWRVRQLLDFIARRMGSNGFAQVSGVRFAARGGRAAEIMVGREPLDGNHTYRVATIDFLYQGGDGYTQFQKAGPAEDTGRDQRQAAIDFLRRHPDYVFRKDGRIRWQPSTEALRDLRMR